MYTQECVYHIVCVHAYVHLYVHSCNASYILHLLVLSKQTIQRKVISQEAPNKSECIVYMPCYIRATNMVTVMVMTIMMTMTSSSMMSVMMRMMRWALEGESKTDAGCDDRNDDGQDDEYDTAVHHGDL